MASAVRTSPTASAPSPIRALTLPSRARILASRSIRPASFASWRARSSRPSAARNRAAERRWAAADRRSAAASAGALAASKAAAACSRHAQCLLPSPLQLERRTRAGGGPRPSRSGSSLSRRSSAASRQAAIASPRSPASSAQAARCSSRSRRSGSSTASGQSSRARRAARAPSRYAWTRWKASGSRRRSAAGSLRLAGLDPVLRHDHGRGAARFEPFGHGPVQLDAPGPGELAVEGVADQRVAERHPVRSRFDRRGRDAPARRATPGGRPRPSPSTGRTPGRRPRRASRRSERRGSRPAACRSTASRTLSGRSAGPGPRPTPSPRRPGLSRPPAASADPSSSTKNGTPSVRSKTAADRDGDAIDPERRPRAAPPSFRRRRVRSRSHRSRPARRSSVRILRIGCALGMSSLRYAARIATGSLSSDRARAREELQRGVVGPLQVVEEDRDRAVGGRKGQRRADGLEQRRPIARLRCQVRAPGAATARCDRSGSSTRAPWTRWSCRSDRGDRAVRRGAVLVPVALDGVLAEVIQDGPDQHRLAHTSLAGQEEQRRATGPGAASARNAASSARSRARSTKRPFTRPRA